MVLSVSVVPHASARPLSLVMTAMVMEGESTVPLHSVMDAMINTVPQLQKMLLGFALPRSTTDTVVAMVMVVLARKIKIASESPSASSVNVVVTAQDVSHPQDTCQMSRELHVLSVAHMCTHARTRGALGCMRTLTCHYRAVVDPLFESTSTELYSWAEVGDAALQPCDLGDRRNDLRFHRQGCGGGNKNVSGDAHGRRHGGPRVYSDVSYDIRADRCVRQCGTREDGKAPCYAQIDLHTHHTPVAAIFLQPDLYQIFSGKTSCLRFSYVQGN